MYCLITRRKQPLPGKPASLRAWLNNDFLNAAFTAEEQESILVTEVDNSDLQSYYFDETVSAGNNTQDKVFLLSFHEALYYSKRYLEDGGFYSLDRKVRRCGMTDYVAHKGAYISGIYFVDGKHTGWWWLRSPGWEQDKAMII